MYNSIWLSHLRKKKKNIQAFHVELKIFHCVFLDKVYKHLLYKHLSLLRSKAFVSVDKRIHLLFIFWSTLCILSKGSSALFFFFKTS